MSDKHVYTCDGVQCDHEVRVDRLSDTPYAWLTLSATDGEQPDKHYCSRACLLDDLQREERFDSQIATMRQDLDNLRTQMALSSGRVVLQDGEV